MINQIYLNIIYFFKLSLSSEVFWNIFPLFASTLIILLYFEKYKNEKQDWSSYLSNSLVLLFVSMSLLRYVYDLDGFGLNNFSINLGKSIAILLLIFVGFTLLRFNFGHILPQKFAKYVSSTITIHLFAYSVILFVYSDLFVDFALFASLFIILIVLSLLLNLLKIPIKMVFDYAEKLKAKERIEDVKEAKFEINELEDKLKERKEKLEKEAIKKLEIQKKEAIKIKKLIKKK